jgi:cytoskeleton protein RodZ
VADVDTHAMAKAGPGATAGAKLRAAREAAGLSIDAVAQQLKLAPRQVTALEEDDWHRLPGRTFVRGFARNYARFVRLDPDAVLALLPTSDASPALERPTLAASPRPMGEMPAERVAKPSAARFVVPLLLFAVVAVVAYYELSRSAFHWPAFLTSLIGNKTDTSSASPPTATTSAAAVATPGTTTSALPNPVADATSAGPAASTGTASAGASATTNAINVLPTPPAANTTPASDVTATPPVPAAVAAEVPLVLAFKGTSWAEVKDAKGRVVLQMTGGAGMKQTVSAMPPLELSLGNAPDVAVTFRGQALDLSAYTRGNVARVSLQ